jgi:hypothetical protein
MASRLSSSLESINLSPPWDPPLFVPPHVVPSLLSCFAEGLIRVNLRGSYVTDEAMEALSLSPAAKTIQELHISNALSPISDASAHVWQRFSALRKLNLQFCNLLDMPTFMALSKHQVIESIKLTCPDRGAPPATAITPILLAPDSLPSLTSMSIPPMYPTQVIQLRDLVDLVRRRPNRVQLTQLGFALQEDGETDLLVELHEMCPNLKALCTSLNDPIPESLLQKLQNISELADDKLPINSEEDLLRVAHRFPRLRSLELGLANVSTLPFLDFRAFANLKSLFLITSVLAPLQLPLALRALYYKLESEHAVDPDQVDSLCLSICNSAPGLKELTMNLPTSSFSRNHANLLVNHLPALEHITLHTNGEEDLLKDGFEICHPNISWASIYGEQSPVPRWWPTKNDIYLQGKVGSIDRILQPSCIPNLRAVNVSLSDDPTDPPPVARFVELIHRFGRQITSLTLDTSSHSLTQDSFTSLMSLRHLSLLELDYVKLTQENAQILVSTMPLLTRLHLSFYPTTSDVSWLKLRHLRTLILQIEANPSGANECDPDLFMLQPNHLPLLTSIRLNSTSPAVSGLLLSGFEHLGTVEMTPRGTSSFEFSVSKCKRLFSVVIQDAPLCLLQLSDLPSLMSIGFRSCLLTNDAVLSVLGCPRLRYCESCKNKVPPAGAEKCLQFEEAVRLQAADVEHLEIE